MLLTLSRIACHRSCWADTTAFRAEYVAWKSGRMKTLHRPAKIALPPSTRDAIYASRFSWRGRFDRESGEGAEARWCTGGGGLYWGIAEVAAVAAAAAVIPPVAAGDDDADGVAQGGDEVDGEGGVVAAAFDGAGVSVSAPVGGSAGAVEVEAASGAAAGDGGAGSSPSPIMTALRRCEGC